MSVTCVDKLDIADEMLDVAISAFFDGRYFAALNLAGVAQELYGKQVRLNGLDDEIQSTIKIANKLAAKRGGTPLEDKTWKKIAGWVKNQVKHFDNRTERHLEITAEDEARLMIGDALGEHHKLQRPVTTNVSRFAQFGSEYAQRAVNSGD